jgi:hypothetical protein
VKKTPGNNVAKVAGETRTSKMIRRLGMRVRFLASHSVPFADKHYPGDTGKAPPVPGFLSSEKTYKTGENISSIEQRLRGTQKSACAPLEKGPIK